MPEHRPYKLLQLRAPFDRTDLMTTIPQEAVDRLVEAAGEDLVLLAD